MKIEIEIPDGYYCTGCPCTILFPGGKEVMWRYGCTLLHAECGSDGEYQNRGVKHPNCPASKKVKK